MIELTVSDFQLYISNPVGFLSIWGQKYDFACVEDFVIILNPDCFTLISHDKVSSSERLGAIKNHPAVSDWPMYLDGRNHKESRNKAKTYAKKTIETINEFGDDIWSHVNSENDSICSETVEKFVFGIYEKVFNLQNDVIFKIANNIKELHKSIFTRDLDSLEFQWNIINKSLQSSDISLMLFIISDTLPSIKHAVACTLKSNNREINYTLIKASISENPPFRHLSRYVIDDIYFNHKFIGKGSTLIFPIYGNCNNTIKDLEFGLGEHKCVGIATTVSFVNKIIENGLREKEYIFHEFKTGSLNLITQY
jgi:hypothetical protein